MSRLRLEVTMKEFIKQKGMDLSIWIMDINFKIYDLIDPDLKCDLANIIYNKIEFAANRLFGFFYTGSEDEFTDAIELAFGEELDHYNIVQQAVIIANGILENN
jgi:hypothetical protein